jgi:F-type H+-transporting ATPase subunit b
MLSRFGKVATLARPSILYRAVTTSANNNNASAATPAAVAEPRRFPHDAPERDFKNFPPLRIKESGKVRIGLIPDEWFKAMYDKTGVTGPYLLFWGGLATILSKEIFVYWADTAEQLVFLGAVIAISKLYGSKIASTLDNMAEKETKAIVSELDNATKEIDVKIANNEALKTLPDANKLINDAKRENIHLQLESAFRQRLAQVHQEVKKRLDYQVAVQNVYKRVEREQAINYILGEVNKSIGANQEKEAFQSGLNALRQLSKKHAGTI